MSTRNTLAMVSAITAMAILRKVAERRAIACQSSPAPSASIAMV